jgi:ABC-type sugar transport system ATPase subunit
MAAVTLEQVRKVYPGGVEAVKGVSLTIPNGSFTVLLGPSGCGKSTLLRMIAGLETVSAGTIRIAERRVNEIEPADRDIAMVFQNYALYPHMSVYDNMAYGLRNRGRAQNRHCRTRGRGRALACHRGFPRPQAARAFGGQRQRVAMGRAIVREPQAFLFDEPLSNLDAKLRVQMRVEIRRLHNRLKATSIFVTHDQVEAMTLADMVVVMNAGRIEQTGGPTEVYRLPATRFVATFIGAPAMNLLRAALPAPASPRSRAAASPSAPRHSPSPWGRRWMWASVPRIWCSAAPVPATACPLPRISSRNWALPGSSTAASGRFRLLSRWRPPAKPSAMAPAPVAVEPAAVHLFDRASGSSLRRGA